MEKKSAIVEFYEADIKKEEDKMKKAKAGKLAEGHKFAGKKDGGIPLWVVAVGVVMLLVVGYIGWQMVSARVAESIRVGAVEPKTVVTGERKANEGKSVKTPAKVGKTVVGKE